MDPERWRRIDGLLQSLLDKPPGERERFLRDAVGGDVELEREIRTLLTAHQDAGSFLDTPAIEQAAHALATDPAGELSDAGDDLIGQTVGRYTIVQRLGSGGMGIVYQAEDIQLQRFVAIKFLAGRTASEPNALNRFQREARSASALSHVNICTVHDFGEHDGRPFIVMERLVGETLRERLLRGRPEMDAVLTLAVDIADGLDAAHAAGIVHRDIKPANIFITDRGRAKILDFGLAQLVSAADGAQMLTEAGATLGTADYMAPEQASGQPVDARADLFSFGVVLAEMATGERPTRGSSVVVDRSPGLARLISRCLERDRTRRIQDASAIRSELQHLKRDTDWHGAAGPVPRRWRRGVLAAAVGVLAIAVTASVVFLRRSPKLTNQGTVVIAAFSNSTGEPGFDDVLRQGLSGQLAQSPLLNIVSDERIRQRLTLMGQPDATTLTPDLARDLCRRNGSGIVVEPSIARLGTQFVLGLRARDCATGDVVVDEQTQASTRENVLAELARLAGRFRTRVGESIDSVQQHSTRLAEATTPSFEALTAYTNARKASGDAAAAPLFLRAVELDPQFAMAHASLGIVYGNLGESALSRVSTIKAFELRDRATDRERFFITTMYHRQVTGNLERERETLELWAQSYPRDAEPHSLLSGTNLQMAGEFEPALVEAQKAIALDPDPIYPYVNRVFSYLYLGQLKESESSIQQVSARGFEIPESFAARYLVSFLKGDRAGMNRQAEQARGRRGAEDWLSHLEGLVLARSGRLREARTASALAVELARSAGQRERAAMFQATIAVYEGLTGERSAAVRSAATALVMANGRDVEYAAAFALAVAGESSRAGSLADDLEQRFPEDSSVRFSYVPTLRALLSLQAGDPSAAIRRLQDFVRFDLMVPSISSNAFFGALDAVYVRGEAYLAADQPVPAAAAFQTVIDHRGIVLADPLDALARLHLARALVQSGDAIRAQDVYRDFLQLWSAADPDLPLLARAKSEYTALGGRPGQ